MLKTSYCGQVTEKAYDGRGGDHGVVGQVVDDVDLEVITLGRPK